MDAAIEIFNANRTWIMPILLLGILYLLLIEIRSMIREVEEEEESDIYSFRSVTGNILHSGKAGFLSGCQGPGVSSRRETERAMAGNSDALNWAGRTLSFRRQGRVA